jgi:cystathionine beta-lyase
MGQERISLTSKTFNLAGLKHANIIIPNKSLRDAYERHFDGGVLPYRIFCPLRRDIVAYRSSVPWMESMLEYIHGNDQMFGAFMASELPGIVKYPLEGTFLAWTDCRSLGLSQDALESFILNEAQLALNEGYIFGHSGSGFERWNLAMPRPALEENLHRFASAVKRLVNRPGCRKHGLPPAARRGRLFLSYQGIRAGLGQTPNPFIEYLRY